MTLTAEQIAALRHGEPLMAFDSDAGVDCVVVHAEVFSAIEDASGESFTADELAGNVRAHVQ